MHDGPMRDDEGDFGEWVPTPEACQLCGGAMHSRSWESHDGAYEDYQYRCDKCGHTFWVEGPDA